MKNLTSQFMLLCDYASISENKKLSINGIFDEFRTSKLPAVLGRGFFVASLTGEQNTVYKLNVKLENGASENLMDLEIVTGSNGKANIVIELVGAKFAQDGRHFLKVIHDNKEVGKVELNVIHLKQADNLKDIKTVN